MTYILALAALFAAVMIFLLAAAAANTPFFAQQYPVLLGVNAAVAIALAGLVGYQLYTLARSLKARVFGSRLTLRLLLLFAVMALAPGVVVYTVSVQFLTRSIESWFDVRVEGALEGGLNLGRAALDSLLADVAAKGHAIAGELAALPPAQQVEMLDTKRAQRSIDEVTLYSNEGAVIATSTRNTAPPSAEALPPTLLAEAHQPTGYAAIEPVGEGGLQLRVLVPVISAAPSAAPRILQLLHPVPAALASSAESVESVYRDYRELAFSRAGLKDLYLVTLTLTLLFALFAAFGAAFIISRRLSAPLANLAAATQAVARGDFARRVTVTSADEIGTLTGSFNRMTEQLDEARGIAEASRHQVEAARARLERILANLSTGVLVFDSDLRLEIANHGAATIVNDDFAALLGARVDDWTALAPLAAAIRNGFGESGASEWQGEIEWPGTGQVLLIRGTVQPEPAGSRIVVFDDVTQLVQAQRAGAWADAARRLAHEIANPLTPIRLSAERLQIKLRPRLADDDGALLDRAIRTIIDQVAGMKAMVDEFREYARLPSPRLAPLDLNRLVNEVLALYDHAGTAISARLDPALPLVYADAAQLRQVIHNLLQNAADALAAIEAPQIEIVTESAGDRACLRVIDNGRGFAEEILPRAFEPYVTTKPRGTGLGLAIVKKIVDEHRGSIRIENRASGGASISITFPLAVGVLQAETSTGT